ncbi:hypothetical protein TorRG33x02_110100 [Trema orientale]|uniref:Uncharacterized protein n=1 Tax=Trema orientale TaxID=63057 RepID=A0A2P5F5P9_TREOI|nr:hypothetical protein TorRG33x02_110100 [Trema orientale]
MGTLNPVLKAFLERVSHTKYTRVVSRKERMASIILTIPELMAFVSQQGAADSSMGGIVSLFSRNIAREWYSHSMIMISNIRVMWYAVPHNQDESEKWQKEIREAEAEAEND